MVASIDVAEEKHFVLSVFSTFKKRWPAALEIKLNSGDSEPPVNSLKEAKQTIKRLEQ